MGICGSHFPPVSQNTDRMHQRDRSLPPVQIDGVLLSHVVIYNFVFLEILIFMLLTCL